MLTHYCNAWLLQLTVKLVLKEWMFSDGSHSSNRYHVSPQQSLDGASSFLSSTGRKIYITVVEGKDLPTKDKNGKCDPYVKLQYGKVVSFPSNLPNVFIVISNINTNYASFR